MGHGHAAAFRLSSTKRVVSPNFCSSIFNIMYNSPSLLPELRTGSVFITTTTRLLHLSILVRVQRVNVCTCEHTLRRYNGISGSVTLVRIKAVLQIGCYLLFLLAAIVVRLLAPDRESCLLALCDGLPLVVPQRSSLQFSLRI